MSDGDQKLPDFEKGIRALLLDEEPTFFDDVPRRPQEAYRELVRNSLLGNVRRGFPLARKLVGEEEADRWAARFLDERGPQTRLFRDVPLDFAQWLHEKAEEDPASLPHPAFAELVKWEVLEIEVLNAPDPAPGPALGARPDDDRVVVFDPSCRLAAFLYPVHLMKRGDGWPKPTSQPSIVVAWRQAERLHWLKLKPAVGQILALSASGASLGEAFATLRAQGGSFDEGFVRSWLCNLKDRGALLGFAEAGTLNGQNRSDA